MYFLYDVHSLSSNIEVSNTHHDELYAVNAGKDAKNDARDEVCLDVRTGAVAPMA